MPTVLSTGQITIVDTNDARPVTAYIVATPGAQQVLSEEGAVSSYAPDWTTANTNTGLLITPKVYIADAGAAVEITGQLTGRKFSTDLSTAITGNGAVSGNASLAAVFVNSGTYAVTHNTSGSTLRVKANMLKTVPQAVIYFEGDYTDPVTSIVTHVIAQIQLGMIKSGAGAMYVLTRGNTSIEQATGATKNVAVVAADLMRASGVETTGVTYRFFEANGSTQIINTGAFNTKYGMKSTSSGVAPAGSVSDIGAGLPASGAWSSNNTLVIHESAVASMGVYRVEAKDSLGVISQAYFTIQDVSDPYVTHIFSSAGDKFQNGIGSTTLLPVVFCGSSQVTDLSGWTFVWTCYDSDGKRTAFVDPARTGVTGGRAILANSAGASASFTYDGAEIVFSPGDIIKCVKPDGFAFFYEVESGSAGSVTIRAAVTNPYLKFTEFPAPSAANSFADGRLFVCTGSQGQRSTSGASAITFTSDEVNFKGTVTVQSNRP